MAIEERDPTLVVGWYLEPFGVAAAIAASEIGKPYAILHAGSDVARLPSDPWLKRTYQAVLEGASRVFVKPPAREVVALLSNDANTADLKAHAVPEWHRRPAVHSLTPRADVLEAAADELRSTVGGSVLAGRLGDAVACEECDLRALIVGKASPTKAIGPTIEAIRNLAERGVRVHLSLVTGGPSHYLSLLGEVVGLASASMHVDVAPFLPPWEVPSLLRFHDTVLCLEHSHDVRWRFFLLVRRPWLSRLRSSGH
jgi:hypothetical protein